MQRVGYGKIDADEETTGKELFEDMALCYPFLRSVRRVNCLIATLVGLFHLDLY